MPTWKFEFRYFRFNSYHFLDQMCELHNINKLNVKICIQMSSDANCIIQNVQYCIIQACYTSRTKNK